MRQDIGLSLKYKLPSVAFLLMFIAALVYLSTFFAFVVLGYASIWDKIYFGFSGFSGTSMKALGLSNVLIELITDFVLLLLAIWGLKSFPFYKRNENALKGTFLWIIILVLSSTFIFSITVAFKNNSVKESFLLKYNPNYISTYGGR